MQLTQLSTESRNELDAVEGNAAESEQSDMQIQTCLSRFSHELNSRYVANFVCSMMSSTPASEILLLTPALDQQCQSLFF